MKIKIALWWFLLLFFLTAILPLQTQIKKSPRDLEKKYRKWLEEEVVYIITPKEKDVFLQLETDRERDIFLEAFWKQRDPDPNTPENEFKKEHYRRISYANQWFGKEGPGEGWRSDMGRIYIILGEPNHIERYENVTEVYPVIIWLYEGKVEYGLPNSFNVVFFKKSGVGEYELYSPVKFGPQSLLIHYMGDPADHLTAYYELMAVEPNIADVSLSLIPGERGYIVSPSIASEILITSNIPRAPRQQVKDTYAEKLLMYKDMVEVEYTANYVDSDSFAKIIWDKSGISFVHYLIEPKRLTFEQVGNKFKTNLEVNGNVADINGNTIYQYEKSIPIEFEREQFNNIKAKLFSFQDMFPLIEGDYKLNILLKNSISKEFTSAERDITVPDPSSLRISPLLLANKIIRNSEYREKNKPFLIGDLQLLPSPRNDFTSEDKLYLYFQILGMTKELKENGIIEYALFKEGEKVHSLIKNIKDCSDTLNYFEEFPLAGLPPAYYNIKVTLLDNTKKEILFEQSDFLISHIPYLHRPWTLSIPMPPSSNPMYANILGIQFSNKKNLQKAMFFLEDAYRKNPSSAKYALDFCRVLFMGKEYEKVKNVASPFLNDEQKHEFLSLIGQSCHALGKLEEAITYYKDYLSHYGVNIHILNSIGECYYRLGNKEEAVVAWEKSLEINPKQENIRKLVESIKEKK